MKHPQKQEDITQDIGNRLTPTVQELLVALTSKDQKQLEAFARRRLNAAASTPWLRRYLGPISPEELVSRAVFAVVVGECDNAAGRPLKTRDRRSAEAFVTCLKGIMRSDLRNLITRAEARYEHVPVGNEEPGSESIDPLDPRDTLAHLALRDLQVVMFAKLYQRAAQKPDLIPIIKQWEEGFMDTPRIASGHPQRKLIHRVRQLARRVLRELSRDLQLSNVTGKEMLL